MHPEVLKWLGNKPQVLVVNRVDMVSSRDMKAWQSYLERFKVPVIWTNGKSGEGCPKVLCPDGRDTATFSGYIRRAMTGLESATTYALRALRNFVKFKSSVRAVLPTLENLSHPLCSGAIWGKVSEGCHLQVVREAVKLSEGINAKRMKRGLQPRAVRAAVVGFPNVGKSALINRFLGRRTCASAPKPGVTRSLKWVRVDKELELLDSPGPPPLLSPEPLQREGSEQPRT